MFVLYIFRWGSMLRVYLIWLCIASFVLEVIMMVGALGCLYITLILKGNIICVKWQAFMLPM